VTGAVKDSNTAHANPWAIATPKSPGWCNVTGAVPAVCPVGNVIVLTHMMPAAVSTKKKLPTSSMQ
jgi:hypothetical protein